MENEFFGSELPAKMLEVKGMKIAPEHRANEASIRRTCWFDYRGLHPVTATYLFAHHYKQQTLKFYESVVDIRTVENARAFVPDDIFMSRDITSMWLARSFADEHGIPYPFLMQFAQTRYLARAQRQFPRPNQLYGEEMEIDVVAAWREQLSRQLTYSKQRRYTMKYWKSRVEQAQHVRFLETQVKSRPAPHHRLLARLLQEDLISLPIIKDAFSQEEADKAERYRAQFM